VLIDHGRPVQLTQDHKPSLPCEKERIERCGGKLYQTKFSLSTTGQSELGPCRVWPGRLSVSRTIGDIEAKDSSMGGIEGVVSCEPDIRSFKALPGSVLILACDGIYDRLTNEDVAKIFSPERLDRTDRSLHQLAGDMVEECLREAMTKDSYDNLSAISVMF
jgi:protein phosphatase 2C family protein 2/3